MANDWGELEDLVRHRFLHEVVGALHKQVPAADEDTIVEAVIDAMAWLVKNGTPAEVDNLGGYLFRTAKRALVRNLQRQRRYIELRPNDALPDRPALPASDALDGVVARVDLGRVLAFVRSLVAAWESDRMRVVVEIYIDGIARDLQLEASEVRDLIEDSTGDVLTVANVWKLKQRGFARLARELDDLAAAGENVPMTRSR